MNVHYPPVRGQQGTARYWAAPHPSFCNAACVQLLSDQAEALPPKGPFQLWQEGGRWNTLFRFLVLAGLSGGSDSRVSLLFAA